MPNSYAQSAQLACPVCGQPFAADIWLIVDVEERPDLAAHARAGDLHAVACPRCGPQGAVDAPLLLYLPRADPATGQPPLIFSPAQQTSAEQDQEMAGGLLGTLAQRLGAAWQDDWLAQVATVQRELLPVALSDDPAAAMRELREEIAGEEIEEELPPAMAAALEAVLRQLADDGVTVESPEDLERALAARPDLQARLEAAMREAEDGAPADNLPGSSGASGKVDDDLPLALPDLINQFLAAATWDDSQRIVEAHPELLSDAADERFALALAEYADNPDAVKMLTTHRALLRRCREAGIARAFAEQMLPPEMLAEAERLGLAPEAFLAQMRAAEQMPPALREVLAELAAAGVEIHSPEDLERALAARPDLHAKLEAAAREISPNDNPGIFRDSGIVPGEDRAPTLPALLDRFVRLNTWDDAQRMVEDHPALLSDEADQMFAAVIDQAQARQDAGAVEHFTRLQAVLRRCREAGVARAFAEQMLNANGLAEAERLGMAPEEFLAQMRAAEQMPPALREVLGELAAAGVEIRSPEDLERALAARPDLAAKLAAMGEGDGPAVPPEFVDDLRRAQEGEQRYRRIGDLAGLDAAAAAWARILDAPGFTSATPRFRLAALNDAAIVFIRRYQARGQPRDLDRALAGWERAVAETPAGSPDLPSLLNNLGTGLSTRFGRTGRLEDLEEAIRVYRQAVAETPAGSPDLPSLLNNLGTGLSTRFGRTGRLEDLEEAIRVYRQAVAETPAGSPDLPSLLNNLGNGLRTRFGRTGRLEDLEEAIRVYRQAVAETPAGSPDLPSRLNNLGTGLSTRFGRTGRLEDLEEAIRVYRQAVAETPAGSPDLPSLLNNLGNGLRTRFGRTGRLEDLEEAIRVYRQAVAETPAGSPDLPSRLNNLGTGLRTRFGRTGRLEDLEEAIRVYRQAVAETPAGSPDLPSRLNNLGTGLSTRFGRTGRLEDLEEAIRVYRQAVAETPAGSPDLPGYLNNLGNGLSTRFGRTGRLEDLEEAIRVYRQAVAETPAGSPDLPGYLNNLGNGLSTRFGRTGRLEDLEEAIRVYRQAVAETPAGSPDLPGYLNNLGNGLRTRFGRTGRLEDLEEAIRVYRQAVAETPAGSPDLPSLLNNLGTGLSTRFGRTGRLEDLEEAIRVYRQAVAETPAGSPDLPGYLNNLGTGLSTRFGRTGRLEDLEEAIRVYRQAVAETPAGSPDLPSLLNNLGNGLRTRFGRTGRLEDLEEAIRVYRQAVAETPAGSPDLPSRLNNLGTGLSTRFGRTGRLEDLEEAIRVYRQAVAETPAGSPDLPSRLNNLGTGLRTRFGRTGRLEDLEEAIRVYRQAVAETPAGSPDLPSRLNNLGTGLRTRFGRTGRLEDLEEAIRVYRQAVAETPAGSPDLPSRLNNLGTGLSTRFGRTGRLEDLEEAIQRYRVTCELGAAAAPQEVLNAARNWGRWAIQRQAWAEVDEAYTHGLTTGRALHRRQVRRADKESWLADVQEMAPAAAYAQARLGDPVRAAVTLEAGRAQLLAEGLEQNRRDLDRLPSLGHGDLHARYLAALAARRRLEQPDAVVADRLAAITAADREFDAVVAAIRGVDGYADFFAEPTFARLQAAAQDGPLVYIAATAAGGLALIVRGAEHKPGFWEKPGLSADAVTAVWLDDLTDARVREWLMGPADDPELGGWLGAYQGWLQALQQAQQFGPLPRDDARRQAAAAAEAAARGHWHAVLDATLQEVWNGAMAPLAAALANPPISQSPNPSISNLQSPLTLIPTGLLALLPLHAAWRADPAAATGRRYFLDDYVVRYAPSATALGYAAQTAATTAAARLLAIDEPAVAGAGRLPNSAREVAAVAGHFTDPTLLAHAAATRTAVLARLAEAQVAHFSCHGANNWGDPLASGLLMAGGELLTVADVLELRLGGARLATLSACETGIPGADLPDEAVMLPSALLQAGYAGVAASLWTVSDISTAMLMAYFYKLWRDDGIDPPAALVLAQRWLRDSSNGEKQAFFAGYAPELAGELKMGMAVAVEFFVAVRKQGMVEERSFAAPFHWAAFYYTGA